MKFSHFLSEDFDQDLPFTRFGFSASSDLSPLAPDLFIPFPLMSLPLQSSTLLS